MYSYSLVSSKKTEIFNRLAKKKLVSENVFIKILENLSESKKYYSQLVFTEDLILIKSISYKKPNILLNSTLEKQSEKLISKYNNKKIVIVYIEGDFRKIKYLPINHFYINFGIALSFSFLINADYDIKI